MVDLSSRLGSLKEKGNGIQIMCFNWTQYIGYSDLGVKIQLLLSSGVFSTGATGALAPIILGNL